MFDDKNGAVEFVHFIHVDKVPLKRWNEVARNDVMI